MFFGFVNVSGREPRRLPCTALSQLPQSSQFSGNILEFHGTALYPRDEKFPFWCSFVYVGV